MLSLHSRQASAGIGFQYRRYRYHTDTAGIGRYPIPSTGIGLSLFVCVCALVSRTMKLWNATAAEHQYTKVDVNIALLLLTRAADIND